MKKVILTVAVVLFMSYNASAEIKVTQDQFDVLGEIGQVIVKKNTSFIGFSGSKDALKVYGISDAEAKKEIAKIDAVELKRVKEEKKSEEALVQKELRKQAIKALNDSGVTLNQVKE